MKSVLGTLALSSSLLLLGCAAHTGLEPLGRGKFSPNVSFGGPLVKTFGTHIPIPYVTAGTNYGLSDNVNLNANLHLLPMAYGVVGLDIGTAWFPLRNQGRRPMLGLEPRLFAYASTKNGVKDRFFIFPDVSGSVAWKVGQGLLYTGFDLAIPVSRPKYDEEAASVIFSPFVGYRWSLGRGYTLLTELKWYGANITTEDAVVEYTTISKKGAIAPIIAIQRGL
jgi:hypothetical protein